MRNLPLLALVGYAAASVTAPAQAQVDVVTPPCVHVVFTGVACSAAGSLWSFESLAKDVRAEYLARYPLTMGRTFSGRMVMGAPGCGSFEDQPADILQSVKMSGGRAYYTLTTKVPFSLGAGSFDVGMVLIARAADARCLPGGPAPTPVPHPASPSLPVVGLPGLQKEGDCGETSIKWVGRRGVSVITFTNGGIQMSRGRIEAGSTRVGDPVRMCLVSIPEACPSGDNRGRVYKVTNLRTKESWTAPDDTRSCGGA